MYCSSCGKQIPDGSTFCTYCGAQQGTAGAQTPAQPEPLRQSQYTAPQPQKKSKDALIAMIAVTAAVIAAIVLGVFVIAPAMKKSDGPSQDAAAESAPADARTVFDFTPTQFMEQIAPQLSEIGVVAAGENGRYAVIEKNTENETAKFLFYISGGAPAPRSDENALTAIQFAYRTGFWADRSELASQIMTASIQLCDGSLDSSDAEQITAGLLDGLQPYSGPGAATETARSEKNDVVYDLYHYVYDSGSEHVDELSLEITLKTEAALLAASTASATPAPAEPTATPAPASGGDSGWADRETNDAYQQILSGIGYKSILTPEDLAEGLDDPTLEFFVRDNGDGTIELHDYAAVDGTVVRYNESLLVRFSGMTEEEKDDMTWTLAFMIKALDELSFVTTGYYERTDGEWGIMTIQCTDLDREANWRALSELDVFSVDGPYPLSAVKQAELADGFISLYQ